MFKNALIVFYCCAMFTKVKAYNEANDLFFYQ